MSAEEFWDVYEKSEDTLDIYDEAYSFFSKKLPDNFEEKYDFIEMISEILNNHETNKKFDKVIEFHNLIKNVHPHLITNFGELSETFIMSYYTFCKNKFDIEKLFTQEVNKSLDSFDTFMDNFKKLIYYQHTDIIDNNILVKYQEAWDSDEIDVEDVRKLAVFKIYHTLEELYLNYLKTGSFEKNDFIKKLDEYKIEKENNILNLYEKIFLEEKIDVEQIHQLLVEDQLKLIRLLEIHFLKSMLKKGFRFPTINCIWVIMGNYWLKNKTHNEPLFSINTEKFEEHLLELPDGFFSDTQSDAFGVIWGSVYIYDFLLENGIIKSEEYQVFLENNRTLKARYIVNYPHSLWEYNFVHHWQKPNGISEMEFEQETLIFEKSLNFDEYDFDSFRNEIQEELATLGELSTYIEHEIVNINNVNKNNLKENNFFWDDEDFFISPTNLKPIVKNSIEKIGRNDPCHCGSGKKFKKCCYTN